MEYKAQLKLQAYLDGELSEAEAAEVANWLARDREAVALLGELRNTRQAFVGLEVGIMLPESREFFWSKIERAIHSQELQPQAAARPRPWLPRWGKILIPAGALAAVAIVALVGLFGSGGLPSEMAVADPGAFTYRDFNSGTTLVWLSYPAEN